MQKGELVTASKIARDITEIKRAQARQDVLLREMDHRIKNLFAVETSLECKRRKGSLFDFPCHVSANGLSGVASLIAKSPTILALLRDLRRFPRCVLSSKRWTHRRPERSVCSIRVRPTCSRPSVRVKEIGDDILSVATGMPAPEGTKTIYICRRWNTGGSVPSTASRRRCFSVNGDS